MDSKNIPHSENKTFEDEYREREQAQLPEELESKLSSLLEEYRERISPYSLDFAEKYFRHLGSSIIDADMNKPERELFTKEALEKLYESTRFDLEQCLRQKLQLKLNQCLIALPGVMISHLEEVYSHPMALKQSKKFFNKLGLKKVEREDTAAISKVQAGSFERGQKQVDNIF